MHYDYLIVGAGLYGAVFARQAADAGKTVFDKNILFCPSFGWVGEGEEVVYNSSDGVLGIGINRGDFARKYGVGLGEKWTVVIEKECGTWDTL